MKINSCIYSITRTIFWKRLKTNYQLFALLFICLLSTNTITAQNELVLKSSYQYPETLNDIWGYADATGNEYALVGLVNGVSIVDVTDPENPVDLFFIEGIRSTWRDLKTIPEGYAYVVNESGDGLMIIDLNKLPNDISYTLDETHFSTAHNIYIDEYNVAYCVGTDTIQGYIALDLKDPLKPVKIGEYGNYCHDIYVRNNIAYTSEVYNGRFAILDIRKKGDLVTLAAQKTFSEFTHNAWLSEDGNYLFTTDEVSAGTVGSYQISDLSNPIPLDNFRPIVETFDPIPHNVHVKGNYLYTSHYTEGVIVLNAYDPSNLTIAEFYDTYPTDTIPPLFRGCWGVYPFLPSGNIIASDRQNGLQVLQSRLLLPITISGNVKDEETGATIENARISEVYHYNTTNSDANGNFDLKLAIDNLSAPVTFVIEKEGYKTKTLKTSVGVNEFNNYEIYLSKDKDVQIRFIDECTGFSLDSVYVEFYDSTTLKRFYSDKSGIVNYVNSFTDDYYFVASKDTFPATIFKESDIENGVIVLKTTAACENAFTPSKNDLLLYPNPLSSNLSISYNYFEINEELEYAIELFDPSGRLVYEDFLSPQKTNLIWDLSFLNSGIYFLAYTANGNTQTIKILKN